VFKKDFKGNPTDMLRMLVMLNAVGALIDFKQHKTALFLGQFCYNWLYMLRFNRDTISIYPTGPTGPAGTITPGPAVADLAATATLDDVIATVNALLASLRAAGVIAA